VARAGFYPVESGRISFRRDGHWYSDAERIDNPRIALLFSRSLRRAPDGSYRLQIGDEQAAVTIEDTPYVVTAVDTSAGDKVMVTLNDGNSEELAYHSLTVGADNALYGAVKQGQFEALFLRSAYYHLSPLFVEESTGGFALRLKGRTYPIRPRSVTPPSS
jgi:hypothetical protein